MLFDKNVLFEKGMLDKMDHWINILSGEHDFTPVSEKKFECMNGSVKTTVVVKFNKAGYAISCDHESKYIPTEKELRIKELKSEIDIAVKARDFRRAVDLQDQLIKLETN